MRLDGQQYEEITRTILQDLDKSGSWRSFTREKLFKEIYEGVEHGLAKISEPEKEPADDEAPLYWFHMQRLQVKKNEEDPDVITTDELEKAEKKQKTYIKVLAKTEREAAQEAGRVSGPIMDGHMWVFRTETISVAVSFD